MFALVFISSSFFLCDDRKERRKAGKRRMKRQERNIRLLRRRADAFLRYASVSLWIWNIVAMLFTMLYACREDMLLEPGKGTGKEVERVFL